MVKTYGHRHSAHIILEFLHVFVGVHQHLHMHPARRKHRRNPLYAVPRQHTTVHIVQTHAHNARITQIIQIRLGRLIRDKPDPPRRIAHRRNSGFRHIVIRPVEDGVHDHAALYAQHVHMMAVARGILIKAAGGGVLNTAIPQRHIIAHHMNMRITRPTRHVSNGRRWCVDRGQGSGQHVGSYRIYGVS